MSGSSDDNGKKSKVVLDSTPAPKIIPGPFETPERFQDPDMQVFLREFFQAALKIQDTYGDIVGAEVPSIQRIGSVGMIPKFVLKKPGVVFKLDVDSEDPRYVVKRGDEKPHYASLSFMKRVAEKNGRDLADVCNYALTEQLEKVIKEVESVIRYDNPAETGFYKRMSARAAHWLSLLPESDQESERSRSGTFTKVVFGRIIDDHVVKNFPDLVRAGDFSHYFVIPTIKFKKKMYVDKIPKVLPAGYSLESCDEPDKRRLVYKRTVPFLIDFGSVDNVATCQARIAEEAVRQRGHIGPDAVAARLEEMLLSPDEASDRIIQKVYEDSMLWLTVHSMYGEDHKISTTPEQIVDMFPHKGRVVMQVENCRDYNLLDGIVSHLLYLAEKNEQPRRFTKNSIRTNGLEVVFVGKETLDALENPRYAWLQTHEGLRWLDTHDGYTYLNSDRGQVWLNTDLGKSWRGSSSGMRYNGYQRRKTETHIPLIDPILIKDDD